MGSVIAHDLEEALGLSSQWIDHPHNTKDFYCITAESLSLKRTTGVQIDQYVPISFCDCVATTKKYSLLLLSNLLSLF